MIIIGAGMVGITTALHLVDSGIRRVLILEEQSIASGSTGKAVGVIRAWHSDTVWRDLAAKSWDFFQQWRCVHRRPVLHDVSLFVVRKQASIQWRQEGAYKLIADEIAFITQAMRAEPYVLAKAIAEHVQQEGVQICEGIHVTGLRTSAGRIIGVNTSSGVIECERCIVACGPYIARLAGFGQVPLHLMRVPIVRFAGQPPAHCPILIDQADDGVYIAPEVDSWLVSLPPSVATVPAPLRRDPGQPQPGDIVKLHARVTTRLPQTMVGRVLHAAYGYYDQTLDGRPLVGPVPGIMGCFMAAGLSGSGFQIAPALGKLLSRLITERGQCDGALESINPVRSGVAWYPQLQRR